MAIELSENDLHDIITWWRASNRYNPNKSEELVRLEMKLVARLFKELNKYQQQEELEVNHMQPNNSTEETLKEMKLLAQKVLDELEEKSDRLENTTLEELIKKLVKEL